MSGSTTAPWSHASGSRRSAAVGPKGFRTWSRRTDLRPPLAGRYTVDVVTSSDQLIGRLRFRVTP